MSLALARYDLAAAIAAAVGETIVVTVDPASVNPPCIFVDAPDQLRDAPCGLYGEVGVWIIMPGPGTLDVLEPALDLVELIRPVVDLVAPITRQPYFPDPSGATALPAYLLPVSI